MKKFKIDCVEFEVDVNAKNPNERIYCKNYDVFGGECGVQYIPGSHYSLLLTRYDVPYYGVVALRTSGEIVELFKEITFIKRIEEI